MAKKAADGVADAAGKPLPPVQRLCNEIQLFDLCELEKCRHKQGLYCTDPQLLDRFEAIAEEEECPTAAGFIPDGPDDAEEADAEGADNGYDDSFDDDPFGDEDCEEDD